MDQSGLAASVEQFARTTVFWPDAELERPWAWRMYDDGVRHAWFRSIEELRELAIDIAVERIARGLAPSIAQRVLAQYHGGYRDLQAILLGVSDDDGNRRPTPEDWPLTNVIVHIIASERHFFARMKDGVDRLRTGDNRPLQMSDDAFLQFYRSEKSIDELREHPLSLIMASFDSLHARVIAELSDIDDDEQDAPSVWWEEEEMPVRFRLHRLESHLRQHSVHAEKTLVGLQIQPTEAKRLSRLLYGALAEVEGNLIGATGVAEEQRRKVAVDISARLIEISAT